MPVRREPPQQHDDADRPDADEPPRHRRRRRAEARAATACDSVGIYLAAGAASAG